jgi:predicted permease
MTDSLRPLFRLALAIVSLAAWLVPDWHRAPWRRQWQADLWERRRWLERRQAFGVGSQADLVGRALGVFRHAFWLRTREWRPEMLLQDVRFGLRVFVRQPAFTVIAVLTLGLGIGANATIASWIDAVVLRPLPGVSRTDRLVELGGTDGTRIGLDMSYPDFVDLRDQRPPGLAGLTCGTLAPMTLRVGNQAGRVWGRLVSGNYFDVLGVRAFAGRTFRPEEDRTPNTHPVAVLSHRFWQRRFGGAREIVGGTVLLNERAFTVIGVAAEGFYGSDVALESDVFVPMMMQPSVMPENLLDSRGNHEFKIQARLAPGASLAQAQAGVDVLVGRLARAHPETNGKRGVAVLPLWRSPQEASSVMGPVLAVLLAMVGVVLLVACANVASLLLVRAVSRQREVAVRLAVGASRGQIVRQFLAESVLLALMGGAAGLVMARWTAGLLAGFLPATPFPLFVEAGLSPRLFLFTLAVTVATGIVFGLAPALQASRSNLVPALKDGGVGGRAGTRAWLRKGFLVAQVAFSLVLLVMAALFLRALGQASTADPGFSLRRGLLATIDLMPGGYDADRGRAFYRDLLARIHSVPGVRAASLAGIVPLSFSGGDTGLDIEGYTPARDENVTIYFNHVAPGYFATMGITLVGGRAIDDRDDANGPRAIVINQTMAQRYWKGADPIGRRVRWGDTWMQVVGVARDGKYETLNESPKPYMYVPLYQAFRPRVTLHVATSGDPIPLVPAIERQVRTLDPRLPVFDVRTMEEHLRLTVFMTRMAAILLGIFGALALLLATTGLYGVLAQVVAQRTREVGIRMALGATRADVVRLVMRQALTPMLAGLALGLVMAMGATPLVASQLIGVGPFDPLAFAATSALLAAATLAASYVPARRAARQHPLDALRDE